MSLFWVFPAGVFAVAAIVLHRRVRDLRGEAASVDHAAAGHVRTADTLTSALDEVAGSLRAQAAPDQRTAGDDEPS